MRGTLSLLLFLALSLAFSWPLAADPLGTSVARQFDGLSLLWLSGVAPFLDGQLHTALSAWPLGESAARADSFVLLALARVLPDPRLPGPLFALLGPPVSAWAAERFARRVGARWPWSIIAGLAYGFSGLVGTALLEGHTYAMLNPWLPLLACRLWAPRHLRDGLLAGLFWSLALLSSAYLGIAATVLVLLLLGRREARRLRPLAGAAAVALPAGLTYLWVFTRSGGGTRIDSALHDAAPQIVLAAGSARLGTLAGWSPATDTMMHSISPTLGFTSLALALFAPVVLRGQRGWRWLAVLAGTGVLLSLGPTLNLFNFDIALPSLLWPLGQLHGWSTFFHFPVRMAWLTELGLGTLAALVATRLAHRQLPWAAPLLLMATVDALAGTGTPLRTARVPLEPPSAYQAPTRDRAILELLPRFHSNTADMELYLNNLGCAWQHTHGHPICNQCLGTTLHQGPRWALSTWLQGALFMDDSTVNIVSTLQSLGIGAVALRPDLYTVEDRADLLRGLEHALGAPLAQSRDGGEYVVIYGVPTAPLPSAQARLLAYERVRP